MGDFPKHVHYRPAIKTRKVNEEGYIAPKICMLSQVLFHGLYKVLHAVEVEVVHYAKVKLVAIGDVKDL